MGTTNDIRLPSLIVCLRVCPPPHSPTRPPDKRDSEGHTRTPTDRKTARHRQTDTQTDTPTAPTDTQPHGPTERDTETPPSTHMINDRTNNTLPGRLELPTLRLTASRSNQLSYGSLHYRRQHCVVELDSLRGHPLNCEPRREDYHDPRAQTAHTHA